MKLHYLLIIVLFTLLLCSCKGGDETSSTGPEEPVPLHPDAAWLKVGCFIRYDPAVPDLETVRKMVRAKLVIVDIELADHKVIRQMKELNPALRIGIYINPMDIFFSAGVLENRPWQRANFAELIQDYDAPHKKKSFFCLRSGPRTKTCILDHQGRPGYVSHEPFHRLSDDQWPAIL